MEEGGREGRREGGRETQTDRNSVFVTERYGGGARVVRANTVERLVANIVCDGRGRENDDVFSCQCHLVAAFATFHHLQAFDSTQLRAASSSF